MSIEVKVPVLPESVADATIAAWHKKEGDKVSRDENLLDLETDKVVLEVPAPADGILKEIVYKEGDTVEAGEILARLEEAGAEKEEEKSEKKKESREKEAEQKAEKEKEEPEKEEGSESIDGDKVTSPAVRRLLAEHDLKPEQIEGSGKSGRITKEDVESYLESKKRSASEKKKEEKEEITSGGEREERRVPMTRLRAKIAERLVQAQHNAAMLTTFNEVNLKAVMDLRAQYKDRFEKKHGVRLGFMSFFTKAVIESLKRFPAVNASIDGQDIVYHGYYDIGIAVSTERGLVVPVLRNAEYMSMADIEKAINDCASRARDGKLSLEEMQGGTFTITNGGVFGSLLATPIINPPQTGILGMHKIEERPIVENGQIVIRPMMYVALSYDHRLIDGKESVQFLVSVKELLEDPSRLLLNI
ncbi:2-oxoglutarate dehydrogenase complex dihydrolipoyllysine-residue succinyltransferase [Legionella israelensis]|uniref:Dihydrolipoyllysine-residue succinyltransferase component of 2-oxoglutarate dehydrogenase complex n=1 Tax=Legionella israelensis TaxID=454 RepID=A0A0W0W1F7_9GAMM|nr:2-oxoglutarate dehydrogenase complex dihydrolipoyllysine-residue succinyltransferase [Legionella israelensis]KTD26089.1 dihydrolipoamide succinyltransferase subunit E2 [Legionella israelensis]QBS10124.1 2-oxoglutarate dehydrogenase complex dihydrolipoyllysine-residue succinyltransferase [Legionella israelensis]QDP73513.1 2-oxoglutarate dehydrogenase complex dihydrolipoyllysine-residue succinyltransferase [Legionella israelensis]SCY07711.1 2-oxoglutarate dehydrogenase E2 component [Legionella